MSFEMFQINSSKIPGLTFCICARRAFCLQETQKVTLESKELKRPNKVRS